jgi:hypothetical protein
MTRQFQRMVHVNEIQMLYNEWKITITNWSYADRGELDIKVTGGSYTNSFVYLFLTFYNAV